MKTNALTQSDMHAREAESVPHARPHVADVVLATMKGEPAFPPRTMPCGKPDPHPELWPVDYYEHEVLNHIDGYMDRCQYPHDRTALTAMVKSVLEIVQMGVRL